MKRKKEELLKEWLSASLRDIDKAKCGAEQELTAPADAGTLVYLQQDAKTKEEV